jgi:transposase-like protein
VDKNAAYPPAINSLTKDQTLPETTELRPVKYLNNIVEQDHRFTKRLVNPGMGFGSFNTARRTLRGYEAMNITALFQFFVPMIVVPHKFCVARGRLSC